MKLSTATSIILSLGIALSSHALWAAPGNKKPAADTVAAAGWYLTTRVSVSDSATGETHGSSNDAVLGALDGSKAGYDRHDIPAFSSTVYSRIAAVFVHPDWGDSSGEYHSDYRSSKKKYDSWLMTVNSTVPGGVVTIGWDGIYDVYHGSGGYQSRLNLRSPLLAKLSLIDMTTLQVIPALKEGGLNAYTLTLDTGETSRQLRWVLGPLKGKYFEPGEGAMRYLAQQRKALSKQTKNKGAKAGGAQHGASQAHPVFGLPPGR